MGSRKLMDLANKLSLSPFKASQASLFNLPLKFETFEISCLEIEKIRSSFEKLFPTMFCNLLKINRLQRFFGWMEIFHKKPLTNKSGNGKKFGLKNLAI